MKDLNLGHIKIIFQYHLRYSLRSGSGIVFLLLTLAAFFTIAGIFITPVENLAESLNQHTTETISTGEMLREIAESETTKGAVNWLVDDSSQGEFLLNKKPALLSCILLITLMLFPYLTIFGAFNQFSSDIATRGLRFILLRTERVNIYLGRFLGSVAFCLITTVVSLALLILYIQLKLGIYEGVSLWLWGAQGAAALFLLSLPIVALCSFISGKIESAFGSLTLCLLSVAVPAIMLMLANNRFNTELMPKLWPTGWKFGILNSGFEIVALACLVLVGFTAFFLWIGLKAFEARDL